MRQVGANPGMIGSPERRRRCSDEYRWGFREMNSIGGLPGQPGPGETSDGVQSAAVVSMPSLPADSDKVEFGRVW
eukprot:8112133-Pyramimonas_sp.AAC.1